LRTALRATLFAASAATAFASRLAIKALVSSDNSNGPFLYFRLELFIASLD
jgi:hypothetical protein